MDTPSPEQPTGVLPPITVGYRLWYQLWRNADGWHARGRLARVTATTAVKLLGRRLHVWLTTTNP